MVPKYLILSLLVVITMLSSFAICSPYNRWGPGEGYGHTGNDLPPENPNAAFGYDHANVLSDSTNYGAVFNRHRSRSGRRLPSSFFSNFGSNRRSDLGNSIDYNNNNPGFKRVSIYRDGNRSPKAHEDFYAALEALFGRFNTPRIL